MRKIDHVIILHGIGANPFIMWFPWMRLKLELMGVHVDVPTLPRSFRPDLAAWRKAAQTALRDAGPSTMIIGHSLGGTLATRLLEEGAARRIGCLVLVSAPIARTLKFDAVIPFFDKKIDWKAVRKGARRFLILHAKTDPVVPFDHSVRYGEHLDTEPVLIEKGRHFDGITNRPLLEMIEPLLKKG